MCVVRRKVLCALLRCKVSKIVGIINGFGGKNGVFSFFCSIFVANMELMTHIDIPVSEWKMEAGAKVLLAGSCFADEVGKRMLRGGFEAMVNPFGTLYNPASIAENLEMCLRGEDCADEVIFQGRDGLWHSWMHHSCFSSSEREVLLAAVERVRREVAAFLKEADVLIVTFGTAVIYRLKEDGMLVANCHKMPDGLFERERMSVACIVERWRLLLERMKGVNPKLKVVFTVSPIRHKRDGFHANQVSKGILLQAVDELAGEHAYFPSYELMMDELRDYRFYADDMIHPSEKAVEYIWQRFQDVYMDGRTRDAVAKSRKEWARQQHRPMFRS